MSQSPLSSKEQTGEATRKEQAQGLRNHYEEVSLKAHHWANQIPKAIDLWEKWPDIEDQISLLKSRIAELEEENAKLKDVDLRAVLAYEAGQKSCEPRIAELKEEASLSVSHRDVLSKEVYRLEAVYSETMEKLKTQENLLSLAQGQIEKMNGALDKIERLVIGGDVYQAFAYAQTIAAEALSSLPPLKTEDTPQRPLFDVIPIITGASPKPEESKKEGQDGA